MIPVELELELGTTSIADSGTSVFEPLGRTPFASVPRAGERVVVFDGQAASVVGVQYAPLASTMIRVELELLVDPARREAVHDALAAAGWQLKRSGWSTRSSAS